MRIYFCIDREYNPLHIHPLLRNFHAMFNRNDYLIVFNNNDLFLMIDGLPNLLNNNDLTIKTIRDGNGRYSLYISPEENGKYMMININVFNCIKSSRFII